MYLVSSILTNGKRFLYGYSMPLSALCKFIRENKRIDVLDVRILDLRRTKSANKTKNQNLGKEVTKL